MNKSQKIVVGVLSALVLLGAGTSAMYYGVYVKQNESGFFHTVGGGLPVARVDSTFISYNDYLIHLKAGRTFLNSPLAQQEGVPQEAFYQVRKSSLDRAIRIQVVQDLSKEKSITVSTTDIDRAYDDLLSRSGTSTSREEAAKVMTELFGWDEANFKQYMVKPALLEDLVLQKMQDEGKTAEQAQQELIDRIEKAKRYLKV